MHLLVIVIDKGAGLVLLAIVGKQAEVKGAADLMTVMPFILMSVANLGLAPSLIYFARRKEHSVQSIAESTAFVALIWGGVIGGAAFLAVRYVVPLVKPDVADVSPWLYAPLCASVPLMLFTSYGNSLQLATDRIRDYNFVHVIQSASFLPLFVLVWWLSGAETTDVTCAIGIARFTTAAAVAASVALMVSRFVKLRFKLHRGFLKDGLRYGWRANINSVLTYVNLRLAPFYVFLFYQSGGEYNAKAALAQVAMVSIATSLAELVWHFPEATRDLFFSRAVGASDNESRRMTAVLSRICVLIAVGGSVAVLPFASILMPLVAGRDEWQDTYASEVITCMLWLIPGTTAFTLAKILQNDLAARGRLDLCISACSVTFVVITVGNVLLTPTYGAQGAAIANSCAYLASSLYSLYVYTRLVGVSWTECVFIRSSDWVYVQGIVNAVLAKIRRRASTQQS